MTPKTTTSNRNIGNVNATGGLPTGWNTISCILRVENVETACEFYQKLGFYVEQNLPAPEGGWTWAQLRLGNSRILMYDRSTPTSNPTHDRQEAKGSIGLGFGFYVYVPNVDSVFEAVKHLGYPPDNDVHEEFWGDRAFTFTDPYGYQWTFATHIKDVPPQEFAQLAFNH